MPLYMDFHIMDDFTIQGLKKAHQADLAVQGKYGVNYIQSWVNQEAGTVFCLVDAPDKESCKKVHKEAHGEVACKIVEVEGGLYKLFMGDSHLLDQGLVISKNGNLDNAYRFVLLIDLRVIIQAKNPGDLNSLIVLDEPKKLIRKIISYHYGRELKDSDYSYIAAVFTDADEAMACANEVQHKLSKNRARSEDPSWNITFKMGIGGGQPVTMNDQFFVKTIRLSRRLSLIADEGEIVASNLVRKMSGLEEKPVKHMALKCIRSTEEEFLEQLFDITEKNLSDEAFNVEKLCHNIGISRPQLYRKVTAITNRSPVSFIRDIRLKKALTLIREDNYNISEVALKIGYNSPSYFSKCFRDKYGINPSKIVF